MTLLRRRFKTGSKITMKFLRHALIPVAAVTLMLGAAIAQQAPPRPMPVPRPVVPEVPVPPAPDVDGQSWVLMDYATGQILASKNPDERRAPASLTKVMTDYVVSAEIAAGHIHPTDPVTISEHAWRAGGAGTDGSTSFLKLGSQVPLEDLLKGMIIQSGNDAAIALAEHTAGSEQAFVGLMNAYAKQLGMTNTHYSDASGYPVDDHYSSARDIAILSRALIHDFPTITPSPRSSSSSGTASSRPTATRCCGATPAWTASRPATPPPPVSAWTPRPSRATSG
jgi:D-alanyl-D-alanine carboxypeptidase